MAAETKPIIFSVDDDPQVLRSVRRDLRSQYKETYRIVGTTSPQEALATLEEWKKRGEEVALLLSDQRMPEMLGVDFLEKAKQYYPEAKRVLLTAYSDTDAAIRAINDVGVDYYLMKPWDPPQEKMYPVLDDQLDAWERQHQPEYRGIRVVGYQYSPKSHKIKDFLSGHLRPYQWVDVDYDKQRAESLMELHEFTTQELPVVVFEEGEYLSDPDLNEVAARVGLSSDAQEDMYDVTIIGAGPAGLAAAVYGGSEGLKTLLVERNRPGGQAGTSSRIENYLGFPKGLSGGELTQRALDQTRKFDVEFLSPKEVAKIELDGNFKKLHMRDGTVVNTKAVVVTTGVAYRKLPGEGIDDFSGRGIYYGAAMTEANSCRGQQVFVVGGGNSAGQGAVYLAQFAKKVTILIRNTPLQDSMSSYLIDQIDGIDNIEVQRYKEVTSAQGQDHLETLCIRDLQTSETTETPADALFVFIGSRPYTEWLAGMLKTNDKGYLETGRDLRKHTDFDRIWKRDREPYLLETCVPGIFAAGDVRAGAMNRVASAVGEGAMAIKFVHTYLAEI